MLRMIMVSELLRSPVRLSWPTSSTLTTPSTLVAMPASAHSVGSQLLTALVLESPST